MLVAPPVPSPPRPSESSSSSTDSRAVLGSSMSGAARPGGSASSGTGTGVGPKGNGSAFAIFRDGTASSSSKDVEPNAEWDDYGTVKSRTRENNAEKKEWEGETLPVKGLTQPGASRPAVAGGFKLEVYRDEVSLAAV
jgi:checkpoint serine/threonine-protein kinase